MKPISFNHLNLKRTETKDTSLFAEWVRKTSELIGRPYMQTFKLVEDWPLHKIERRYKEAMDCGEMKPAVKWWWLRKKERVDNPQNSEK